MKIGAVFPQMEIGADPIVIRDFAQAIEQMGFSHMVVYDHVINPDMTNRQDLPDFYDIDDTFHEPLVLFSYLAGLTNTLEFATGVLILPQRQAALVAKQAANVDIFLQGRLRLGVGIGWNKMEYEALGVPMTKRGARLDEQINFMRQLWTRRSSSFDGHFHTLTEGGVCPMPVQQPIPIWIGGVSPPAMRRAATLGDGWLPIIKAEVAEEEIAKFRELVVAANRNPKEVGIENIIVIGDSVLGPRRSWEDAVADYAIWNKVGIDRVSIDTMSGGLARPDDHLHMLEKIIQST